MTPECPRGTVHSEFVRLPIPERDELLALVRALRAALDGDEPRRARELGLELERRLEAAGVAAASETA